MTQYARDPAEWPLVLVGPIVRRVSESSVSVFVATSNPADVTLEIYEGTDPLVGYETSRLPLNAANPGFASTWPLGRRLHVAVVEATGLSLSTRTLYGYNVLFQVSGNPVVDVATSSAILDTDGLGVPLGYVADELPGFVLPAPRQSLKLIHGSCRKPHGGGPDMLPLVDALIAENRLNPDARPQQLFLTGDQIYADDVASGLLPALTEAADLLLDWNNRELIPDRDGVPAFDPTYWRLQPGRRSGFLEVQGVRDETHYSDNHLLFFGEWCAMYVMAWSNAIWKRSMQADHTFELGETTSLPIGHWHGSATREALRYAERLANVQRALANIPTYMLFDDHEVTDDWYLNRDVANRLRSTPVGRRIVRNALLAYAVFQDWGNQPWDFQPGTHGRAILDAIRSGLPTGAGHIAAPIIQQSPGALDDILDIDATPRPIDEWSSRKRWDYGVAGPEHLVLAVDTRTWRSYPDTLGGLQSDRFNAALIFDEAQELQLFDQSGPVQRSLRDVPDTALKIVISPAPVIGMWLVELFQKVKIAAGPVEGVEEVDNEPWAGNAAAFESFLHRLAPYSPVVFLSGDVHYAFSQLATYAEYLADGAPANLARFIQLCSSSSKNSNNLTNILSVGELVTGPLAQNWYIGGEEAMQFVREQGPDLLDRAWELLEAWLQDAVQDSDRRRLLDRAWRKAKKLRWVDDLGDALRLADLLLAGPVEYQQLMLLKDQLWPDPSSGFTVGTKSLTDGRDPELRDDHSADLQARLGRVSEDERMGVLRRNAGSVGVCNFGVVTFDQGAGGASGEWLLHTLYWRHVREPVDPFQGAMTTEHRVELRTPANPGDLTP